MRLVGGVAVVGPTGVRLWSRTVGTVRAPAGLADAALAGIDDELVPDNTATPVEESWRAVFEPLSAHVAGPVALVCPCWWLPRRLAVVQSAARAAGLDVVMRTRSAVLTETTSGRTIVVEVADDLVAVSCGGDHPNWAEAYRHDDVTSTAAAVARTITSLGSAESTVIIDCATTAAHTRFLAEAVVAQLLPRRASVGSDDRVLRAAARTHVQGARIHWSTGDEPSRGLPLRRFVVVAGVAASLAATAVLPRGAGDPTALVVAGRVALEIPAGWHVERIFDGPGAPRLQASSPTDHEAAVHVRQVPVPLGETLSGTADTLRRALAGEPAGVFVDFEAHDRRGGRVVVSYREVRQSHEVAWAVLVEDGLRIAVGCQAAPGRAEAMRVTCERAVATVRDVFNSAGTDSALRQSNYT